MTDINDSVMHPSAANMFSILAKEREQQLFFLLICLYITLNGRLEDKV
jgi:hypothetical protein